VSTHHLVRIKRAENVRGAHRMVYVLILFH
jgi:hypothetical protein